MCTVVPLLLPAPCGNSAAAVEAGMAASNIAATSAALHGAGQHCHDRLCRRDRSLSLTMSELPLRFATPSDWSCD